MDPDGTDFWSGNIIFGSVLEVNIATGAIEEQWNVGSGPLLFNGISVYAGLGSSPVPEPSTWMMMAIGFAGLGFAGYRRMRVVVRPSC